MTKDTPTQAFDEIRSKYRIREEAGNELKGKTPAEQDSDNRAWALMIILYGSFGLIGLISLFAALSPLWLPMSDWKQVTSYLMEVTKITLPLATFVLGQVFTIRRR